MEIAMNNEAIPLLKIKGATSVDLMSDKHLGVNNLFSQYRRRKVPDFSSYPFVCQNIRSNFDVDSESPDLLTFLANLDSDIKRVFPQDGFPFTQVKELVFYSNRRQSLDWKSGSISDQLIHYFPNLLSLTLKVHDWTHHNKFLKETLKRISQTGEDWSPNLHSLEIWPGQVRSTRISSVRNLGRKLKKLRMGPIQLTSCNDVKRFQDFLNFNSFNETLQEFEFQIELVHWSPERLVLPHIPRLRKLELLFRNKAPKIEPFLYIIHFPVLEHFRYEHWTQFCQPWLDIFFPAEGQVCNSVKTVSLKLYGLDVREELPNLEKLFPMAAIVDS
ncbi:hypothetical protein Fcan01_28520 [Folsomia candida]|uniref:Uncharacterized protein n=1 Tax=Folsomia candida TaxID=158441 RepID=A0A226CW23_FOLCA|nr:hypothetical protein Fcan01_28520 [Folsomia candida]